MRSSDIYDAYVRLLALPDDTPDLRRRRHVVTAPVAVTPAVRSARITALRQAWLTRRLNDVHVDGADNEPVLPLPQPARRLRLAPRRTA